MFSDPLALLPLSNVACWAWVGEYLVISQRLGTAQDKNSSKDKIVTDLPASDLEKEMEKENEKRSAHDATSQTVTSNF